MRILFLSSGYNYNNPTKCGAPPTCTCCPDDWWHVSDEDHRGRVLMTEGTVPLGLNHQQWHLFHDGAPGGRCWFLPVVCMWPPLHVSVCMLCPILIPQRTSAVSLAPQSITPCAVLVASWAAASHTRPWCPSTWSSAACRLVWEARPPHDRRQGDGATSGWWWQHGCWHILRCSACRQPGWLHAYKAFKQHFYQQ